MKILDKISEKFKKKLEIFSELCYNNSIKTAVAAWAAASGQKPEDKMKRLAETYTDGLIDRETYKARLADLTAQLETARNAPKTPSEPPAELARQILHGDMQSAYAAMDRTGKRAFWIALMQSATIDEDYQIRNVNFL